MMTLRVKKLRKGQLLVKLGHYHAEPHEAEATPKAKKLLRWGAAQKLPGTKHRCLPCVGQSIGRRASAARGVASRHS